MKATYLTYFRDEPKKRPIEKPRVKGVYRVVNTGELVKAEPVYCWRSNMGEEYMVKLNDGFIIAEPVTAKQAKQFFKNHLN